MQETVSSEISTLHSASIGGIVKIVLVTVFALLWAIWIQPHTIALRHILLSVGSLMGLYVISHHLSLFRGRLALPIYLIGLLFVWVTFHLFFLSHQFSLQLDEYLSIWKRIIWGLPFAVGLGIVFGLKNNHKRVERHEDLADEKVVWWIFYAGIVAPTFIYLMRSGLMLISQKFGLELSNSLIHFPITSTWHVPKMAWVFFCLPALALACGQCVRIACKQASYSFLAITIYIATIAAVLTVFFLENTKNGIVFSVALILAALAIIVFSKRARWRWHDSVVTTVVIFALFFVVNRHIEQNDSWKTLLADIKVAQQYKEIDSWKYYGAKGRPTNELGREVSITNYERAAWGLVGLDFINELPLGYGLVHESFGHFGKDKWPDSQLFQAHSAWLDLTLGIGIPGILLLIFAGALALKNAYQVAPRLWAGSACWLIGSIALLMTTTEVSRPVYVEALIFLVVWTSGLSLSTNYSSRSLSPIPYQIKPKA